MGDLGSPLPFTVRLRGGAGRGLGTDTPTQKLQLRVSNFKSWRSQCCPQGSPNPQPHLPASSLHLHWETSRSSAHSHVFLPRAQSLCSPSQQDFLLISRKLQAGARGQESLGENTTVSLQHLPLPTPSAGPGAAKPNRTVTVRG